MIHIKKIIIFITMLISVLTINTSVKQTKNLKYYGDMETAELIKKDNRTYFTLSVIGTIIISTIGITIIKTKKN